MTAYFPSHSYTTSAYGQPAYGMAGSYVAPGAMYVPAYTLSSSTPPYGHDYYSAPQVLSGVPTVAAPGPMYVPTSVPSYVSSHHGHGHRRHRRHSYPYHQYSYSAAPVIMVRLLLTSSFFKPSSSNSAATIIQCVYAIQSTLLESSRPPFLWPRA